MIADIHLGYEWARGESGNCVVAHSLHETIKRLESMLERARVTRLVVAGDLVESPRACRRTDDDIRTLRAWLAARGVALVALAGNHDRRAYDPAESSEAADALPATCTVAGWTIGHGHRALRKLRTISGHYHPVLRHQGHTAPCFVAGPGRIILPPFSSNAAGCDVASAAVPRAWTAAKLRCVVSTGNDLLDFGPVSELRRRLLRLL